jgi:poly(3-hydroxybutyrate) depolymerase
MIVETVASEAQSINGGTMVAALSSRPVATMTGIEVPGPSILFRKCMSWPAARYFLILPKTGQGQSRVLVSVHGISLNAWEHAEIFARYCDQHGLTVVAPLFLPEHFRGFQRFGQRRKKSGPRADRALDAILDEVAEVFGVPTDRIFMFGFSGGGQFVHRYAMANPERVIAAAMGSPGWFTFPDAQDPFPYGIAPANRDGPGGFDPNRFLKVPMAVWVGSRDHVRDAALRASSDIDERQGTSRIERGRRWIDAMRAAARPRGLTTRYHFEELDGCRHSFSECVRNGEIDRRALNFLVGGGRQD